MRLVVAICLPPALLYAWAHFGCWWLVSRPWWGSGNPHEAIFRPVLIEQPSIICSVMLGLDAVGVVAMVVLRRWRAYWLTALVLIPIVWIIFGVLMFQIDDRVFP